MPGSMSDPPVFGMAPSGTACRLRLAAYAIIQSKDNRTAAIKAVVRGKGYYWLPGGGTMEGETPEETVVREVREELGRKIRLLDRVGEAIQYFYAGDERQWYEMKAVFIRAEFADDAGGGGEYELLWVDPCQDKGLFFHECHVWAVKRAQGC